MKKIINPWKGLEGYNCFGCASNNEAGLKMEFYEDGDEVVSIWKPRPEYQGWIDTLHGGIQAVLMDEICAWVILRKLQTTGVTSKMETRYRKSIDTKDSHIVLRASIKEVKRNIVIKKENDAQRYENKSGLTPVEFRLRTGRTHQIRVHAAAVGHPLAGDWLYGTEEPELIGRPALHSYRLEFVHPLRGEKLCIKAELPQDMQKLLSGR